MSNCITVNAVFLSTPSSQRATRVCAANRALYGAISIHALFAEGDHAGKTVIRCSANFYPRPLRRGRHSRSHRPDTRGYFYPRPLRRGRLRHPARPDAPRHFYPRPLRRGRRIHPRGCLACSPHFYPRPLRRGRHFCGARNTELCRISIHALFAEGDADTTRHTQTGYYFYPRPLRRGRPGGFETRAALQSPFLSTPSSQRATAALDPLALWDLFLSTPSSQRATLSAHPYSALDHISIHALFAEGDFENMCYTLTK